MREVVAEALVVDKNPRRELDHTVTLYAEGLGLVFAHLKSSRKIASKLSPHLEPLTLTTVRLVKNKHLHVTDALASRRLTVNRANLNALRFFKEFFAEESYEPAVWKTIHDSSTAPRKTLFGEPLLTALGFDPEHARCEVCGAARPRYFSALAYYVCDQCVLAHAVPERCLVVYETEPDVVK